MEEIFFLVLGIWKGVPPWQAVECGPANLKVAGSIPSQGTCLGCGQVPAWGRMRNKKYIYENI